MKLLGIITFNIIFGTLFTYLGGIGNPDFLKYFLYNQILPISATIIGFNVAGITFLIGHLLQIEGDFSSTKKEIMQNIYVTGILFLIILFLLLTKPTPTENKTFDFLFQSSVMTLFFLQIYAIYEIVGAVFSITPKK